VIWGSHERSDGWSQPEALWRGIPGADLAVVPNTAHKVHLENPQIFDALPADFFGMDPSMLTGRNRDCRLKNMTEEIGKPWF